MLATTITLRPDWLLELNLAGASVAATACFYAAFVGDKTQRLKFIVIGLFATVYAVSDCAQAVSTNPAPWLTVGRACALPVWIVVWTYPAVASVWRWHKLRSGVASVLLEARDKVDSDTP